MIEKDDWRLTSQENYLTGVTVEFKKYRQRSAEWDHDHCSFCWATFTENLHDDDLNEGYTTENDYHWICVPCFKDFKEMFKWEVINEQKP